MATSGVFNPEQPWQDQIDRPTVQTLLQHWIPDALNTLGFDALWTPKRLINQFAAGNLEREPVLQILARYPYLRVPPTPETETFADIPDEGSFHDVAWATRPGLIDNAFYAEASALKNELRTRPNSELLR